MTQRGRDMIRLTHRLRQWLIRPLERAQATFRSRRGSVLIIVVALLVLLALMGTAYIASARLERYAAVAAGGQRVIRESVDSYAHQLLEQVQSSVATDAGNLVTCPTSSDAGTLFAASRDATFLPDLVNGGPST